MGRFLDWRVVSQDYIDNARPRAFTNPITGERLELDRLYLDSSVGFEFNGPQHYMQTDKFADEESLKQQQNRDILKKGLSIDAKVTLVVVTVDQLHPSILETLIPPHLERRPIDTDGPYYRAFVDLSIQLVARARSWKKRQ